MREVAKFRPNHSIVHDMLKVCRCRFEAELHALCHVEAILRGQTAVALQGGQNGYVVETSFDVQGSEHWHPTQRIHTSLAVGQLVAGALV